MQQELGNSILAMRAAVLVRLAEYKRMYYDAKSIGLLVKTLPDEQVWSYIVGENSGFLGFCRRFVFHLTHHE
jgi:hypothetical protein